MRRSRVTDIYKLIYIHYNCIFNIKNNKPNYNNVRQRRAHGKNVNKKIFTYSSKPVNKQCVTEMSVIESMTRDLELGHQVYYIQYKTTTTLIIPWSHDHACYFWRGVGRKLQTQNTIINIIQGCIVAQWCETQLVFLNTEFDSASISSGDFY